VDAREAARTDPAFPLVLFVHQSSVADGADFFGWIEPTARAIADEGLVLYRGFGLERGGVKEVLGPADWACGLRASRKGHGVGRPVGHVWQMPGYSLVEGDRVVWEHCPRHIGDHPPWTALGRLARPRA
jgi:hypothetical protein